MGPFTSTEMGPLLVEALTCLFLKRFVSGLATAVFGGSLKDTAVVLEHVKSGVFEEHLPLYCQRHATSSWASWLGGATGADNHNKHQVLNTKEIVN